MPPKLILLTVGLGVGGTETHVLELASRIDRTRFDVTVCSLKSGGGLVDELRTRGVRFVSLEGAGKFDARVLLRLWKLLRKERPDIVQAFLFWANIAARLMGRASGEFPVISSYHDEVVSEGWVERSIDRLTLKWSHTIVCCSEAVRRSVSSRIGGDAARYAVIPFGVDMRLFSTNNVATRRELGLKENGPIIGTVCRLVEPKKGLSVLLEAMADLKRFGGTPGCQLLIVGDGPARVMLQELCERLEIAPWVVFSGIRRDIPRVLPVMQAFVLPSLYEGFGISILEAMAVGRPVIATSVGGIPEFVTHDVTGLLVEPGNVTALSGAIKNVLVNSEHARQMGLRGQEHVRRKYGIASVVWQHEQVYEACLAHA
jgi:glycosyltransferase involved in cell wall biosynthesis